MPAYFDTGFCVRQPSWHRQETLLADYPADWAEARTIAGIDWEPEEHDLWVQHSIMPGQPLPEGGRILFYGMRENPGRHPGQPHQVVVPVRSHKAIVRSDTGAQLGTVGADFHPITHAVMGELVEALLGQPNVQIETMLSIREGRQVAATILLDEPYTLPGDDSPTLPYLVVLNAHDGSSACKAIATQVRVVCANTYQAAAMDGDRTGRQFVFRHTSGVMARIEDAKAAISGARQDAAQWVQMATDLAVLPAPPEAAARFISEFIPAPAADIVSDRVRANIEAARSMFSMTYEASPTCAANHGSALGLVHAAVEYLDHARGYRTRDTLIGRQLLKPEPLKAKAVRIAREVCAA